jgi:hypothetical protein
MNSIEGLVPCTVDSSGRFGSLTSSRLWSSNCHPTTILPPFAHNRSIRGLPPTRLQANAAASLASTSLLGLGLLPKADHGWREAHGLHFWFTRDYSATLPSQWSNKSLVAISSSFFPSHLDGALSLAHPVSTRPIVLRRSLQTAAAASRVPRPTYDLTSAFFYVTNLVTTLSIIPRPPLFSEHILTSLLSVPYLVDTSRVYQVGYIRSNGQHTH